MFHRNIYQYLNEWKNRKGRKPLLLRGARQVGKTSAVVEFGKKHFRNSICLNLEKADDSRLFSEVLKIPDLVQLIELHSGYKVVEGETLLFIDEIQNSTVAMTQLRYFFEEIPQLHVIAAGSLLEVKMIREGFSIPVGRVEYLYLHPVTFDEFLYALGDEQTFDFLRKIHITSPIPKATHGLLLKKFFEYVIVGGMPEAVAKYANGASFIDLNPVYESLLKGFRDDVFKYSSRAQVAYIQFIIAQSPLYAGTRIKYEKFGGSSYKSREMRTAFDTLEKAMLLRRVYASSSVKKPVTANFKKSPKLIFLDMGLVNYSLGVREDILNTNELGGTFRGQIAEQVVAQALSAFFVTREPELMYWYRESSGSTAEVDYLRIHKEHLVPIEVKSGKIGTLRSLHQFMHASGHKLALRVYSGNMDVRNVELENKKTYTLLSLPFYLLFRLDEMVEEVLSARAT